MKTRAFFHFFRSFHALSAATIRCVIFFSTSFFHFSLFLFFCIVWDIFRFLNHMKASHVGVPQSLQKGLENDRYLYYLYSYIFLSFLFYSLLTRHRLPPSLLCHSFPCVCIFFSFQGCAAAFVNSRCLLWFIAWEDSWSSLTV